MFERCTNISERKIISCQAWGFEVSMRLSFKLNRIITFRMKNKREHSKLNLTFQFNSVLLEILCWNGYYQWRMVGEGRGPHLANLVKHDIRFVYQFVCYYVNFILTSTKYLSNIVLIKNVRGQSKQRKSSRSIQPFSRPFVSVESPSAFRRQLRNGKPFGCNS